MDAIIIDDELPCIDHLTGLLTAHCGQAIRFLGSFRSVEEGVRGIARLRPELVFLDIQLGEDTGFDLLRQLQVIDFDIIFVTAYEQYAVQAFKWSAIDYLVKPVDPDDLRQAVARLQQKRSREEGLRKLETLFHNLRSDPGIPKRISIPTISGLTVLPVNEIIRCESHVNYTSLFTTGGQKLTVAKTLKEFEELLADHHFFRVHNSHLINLAYIRSYNRGKGGTVSMTDDSEVEVSTRRKDELLKRLAEL